MSCQDASLSKDEHGLPQYRHVMLAPEAFYLESGHDFAPVWTRQVRNTRPDSRRHARGKILEATSQNEMDEGPSRHGTEGDKE